MIYRKEIDGLRGIAVLAVIFSHLDYLVPIQIFKSGFVGVDIFFLISGYLITSLILDEIYKTNNFNILNFLLRRVRRLMPALLFMIAACSILTPFFFYRDNLIQYSNSVFFSLIYLSNFFFNFSNTSYFDSNVLYQPLIHTWSLSIEEQYYFVFPLVLLCLHKLNLKFSIIIFILISIFSFHFYKDNNLSTFYLTHTRIWEILCGSLIALSYTNSKNKIFINSLFKKELLNILSKIFPIIGVLLIVISFNLNYHYFQTYNPYYVLIPIIGTSLLIVFSRENELVLKFLSNKFIVYIGLISYSLYLWHYPIICFYNIYNDNIDKNDLWFVIFIIFIISIFSYHVVEQPLRKKTTTKQLLIIVSILMAFVIIINFAIKSGIFSSNEENLINSSNNFNLEKKNFTEFARSISNEFNDKKNNKDKVLIIGDSHAINFAYLIFMNRNKFQNHLFEYVSPIERGLNQHKFPVRCLKNYLFNKDTICGSDYNNLKYQIQKANLIIITQKWNDPDIQILPEVIKKLLMLKKRVIVVGEQISMSKNYFKKITRLNVSVDKKFIYKTEKELFNYVNKNKKRKKIQQDLKEELSIFKQNKNVIFIDPYKYYCDQVEKRCYVFNSQSEIIFLDEDHLNSVGGKFLGEKFANLGYLN